MLYDLSSLKTVEILDCGCSFWCLKVLHWYIYCSLVNLYKVLKFYEYFSSNINFWGCVVASLCFCVSMALPLVIDNTGSLFFQENGVYTIAKLILPNKQKNAAKTNLLQVISMSIVLQYWVTEIWGNWDNINSLPVSVVSGRENIGCKRLAWKQMLFKQHKGLNSDFSGWGDQMILFMYFFAGQ